MNLWGTPFNSEGSLSQNQNVQKRNSRGHVGEQNALHRSQPGSARPSSSIARAQETLGFIQLSFPELKIATDVQKNGLAEVLKMWVPEAEPWAAIRVHIGPTL